MNELNSFQDSLQQYNDTSKRTETDQELQQFINSTSPTEEPQEGALHVERDSEDQPVVAQDGPKNAQEVLGKTPTEKPAQSQEEADKDYQGSLINEAADWMSEKLLGRSREESQALREGGKAEQAATQEKLDNSFAGDAVKAVTSGVEKAAQDVIGSANFVGDLAKTKLGMVEEDDVWNNTDHKNYRGSERDLIFAEPRSAAGEFARDMVSFVTLANKVKLVSGLGKAGAAAQSPAARIAVETTAGVIADFIADPGDGNATNAIQEVFPALKDVNLLAAFAHANDDDEFSRRLKNSIEGGVMGNAVDAAGKGIHALFKSIAPYMKWLKANPGKKAADAPRSVKDSAMADLAKALEGADGIDADDVDFRWQERPGAKTRLEEAKANGGTKSAPEYEPYERAGMTTETPIAKVIKEQEYDRAKHPFTPGAPSPRLTDNTVRQITEAGGDVKVIQKAVKELEDNLLPALRASDEKVKKEAMERLAKLHMDNTGEKIDMSALTDITGEGDEAAAYIRQVLGNTVAKSYMRDLSSQISRLAEQAKSITDTGMDANRQYNLMLDRLKAVSTLQIRDGSRRGVGLLAMKNKVLGVNEDAIAKKISEFDNKVEDLRSRINKGDIEAAEDMRVLADALALSDGDADMALDFGRKFMQMTRQNFETTMFNSYLSGLVTHERNALGNGANVILKPLQIAMGAHGAKKDEMYKSAMAMYSGMWGDLREGFRVGRTALMNGTPDRFSKVEGFAGMDMKQKVKNLRATAKGPIEQTAAAFASAQYHMLANPWLQGATRMLDAADRGFRVLSARQKLRYDQNMLALEDGMKFDKGKFDTVWSTKFKNGEIVDEDLLNYAKQDTFQEDLGKNMSLFQEMLNVVPFSKYIVPFVKTPTNIIKQSAHYVPLLGRGVLAFNSVTGTKFFKEYDAVMKGGDSMQKAIYQGREATGYMMAVLGMGLGTQGLITGQGPQDPQKRKLWLEAGNQPHSVNVLGTWVSTRFLGPIGILLSAYADLGMVASTAGSYDDFDEMRAQLIYSTAGALTDQSFLKGLFAGMEGLNELLSGKAQERKPGEWQASLLRALTPYQAALRGFNNALMPGLREYNNGIDKYLAETLPGAKRFLGAERRSMITGEPVGNDAYSVINQFSPFSLREIKENPVLGKMIDLGVDMPMEMADKYKGVVLTAEEQNEINRRIAKSGLWKRIEETIMSKEFDAVVDAWRAEPTPIPREKAAWMKEIKGLLYDYRNQVINDYRNDNPEFNAKIQAIEDRDYFGKRGDYYGASEAQALINLAN